MEIKISFHHKAFNDYMDFAYKDKKIFKKLNLLIKEILRTPFEGSGNPEMLKYKKTGFLSRRITKMIDWYIKW